jgi:hypothetical protein
MGGLLAAGAILAHFIIRRSGLRNPRRESGIEGREKERAKFSGRALWDVADRSRGPVIGKEA